MLSSILLYLEDEDRADSAIRLAVRLAKRAKARVRGVTLVDTRHHQDACAHESAAFATLAQSALVLSEHRQHGARHRLSDACLKAKVNFDIRKYAGDPVEVLGREARFHDVVVTSGFVGNGSLGMTSKDLSGLVQRSSNPLVVLHPQRHTLRRVLLVYDGTESAARAIRSYLMLGPLDEAEHRLMAVGKSVDEAIELLREMGEYCDARCPELECGYVEGQMHHLLVPYVNKWQADLAVIGSTTGGAFLRWNSGASLAQLLRETSCACWTSN